LKKFIFTISLVLVLALSSVMAFAQDQIIVNIDSNKVEFNDASGSPFIDENSRTQVPFKVTLEKFGATVKWDNETRSAVATKGEITVQVPIGEKYILKNNEKIVTDTAAIIKDSKTYLPISAVVKAFGADVQWDGALKTVVITTQPVDAKKILMDAYTKSAAWDNYDSKIAMDMVMSVPDETGALQAINMKMNMDMTAFTKPQKIKMSAAMNAEVSGEKIDQPIMDMYLTIDGKKVVTYMGMTDAAGKLTWTKSTVEDELSQLANYDIKANLALTEKYTKDVKFLGKYADESGNTLLRIQNTLSGEAYKDLLGGMMTQLASSTNTADVLAADMLKNMGDFQFIVFVDEKSGEIVKYEMDLGSIYASMFSGMTESEAMPKEALDALKNLKATMVMKVLNINAAKDFEIPKEALDAIEAAPLAEQVK